MGSPKNRFWRGVGGSRFEKNFDEQVFPWLDSIERLFGGNVRSILDMAIEQAFGGNVRSIAGR